MCAPGVPELGEPHPDHGDLQRSSFHGAPRGRCYKSRRSAWLRRDEGRRFLAPIGPGGELVDDVLADALKDDDPLELANMVLAQDHPGSLSKPVLLALFPGVIIGHPGGTVPGERERAAGKKAA